MIHGIWNIREHKGKSYTDIVYEWEQDIAKMCNVPVEYWGKRHVFASHFIKRMPFLESAVKFMLFGSRKRCLRFVMNALEDTPLFNHKTCVPVIIDFFVPEERIKEFISIYDKCEYVCVSSSQAFDRLSQEKLPFKLVHYPLSLSERYLPKTGEVFEKKYALTLLGTQIHDKDYSAYVNEYARRHPDFEFVAKESDTNVYRTNTGDFVCDASSRDEYMKLLRASQVVIYSTPGIRGRKDAHGYDQVTPKFLEMIAAQCQVILRYPDNSDTRFFELDRFGKSVECYEDFERQLDFCLANNPDYAKLLDYMRKHVTVPPQL